MEKMKTAEYAKKLRARRTELKAAHEKAVRGYPAACRAWRAAVKKWLAANGASGIDSITDKQIRAKAGTRFASDKLLADFFDDAPQPPVCPDNKVVVAIGRELTKLAILGRAEVYVNEDDIKKFFGDAEDD